ncbi:twin-arginine translocation signal domain-containing protein, partial [Streptomyces sp. NPDC000188]
MPSLEPHQGVLSMSSYPRRQVLGTAAAVTAAAAVPLAAAGPAAASDGT